MNLAELNLWSAQWAAAMIRACGQGSMVIGGVWLVCRLFPRLRPELRTAFWWLACGKMLLCLVTAGPVTLAVLPAASPATVTARPKTAISERHVKQQEDKYVALSPPLPTVEKASADPILVRHESLTPASALLCFWLTGVLFLMGKFCREERSARHLAKDATPCTAVVTIREMTQAVGLRQPPTVLVSEQADCSFVIGPWRPTIVLCKKDLSLLSARELGALLAHELSHIQRHDLAAGILPNLARVLFFFNPLVWLACYEYDIAREAACDAAALRVSGIAPTDYGHLLLKLGIMPATFGPRSGTAVLGAASPYAVLLRRRLEGLRTLGRFTAPPPRWRSVLVLTAAAGVLSLNPVRGNIRFLPSQPTLGRKETGQGARRVSFPTSAVTNYRLPAPPLKAVALSSLSPVTKVSPGPSHSENTKEEPMMLKHLTARQIKLSTALSAAALATIAKPVLSSAPVAQVSPTPTAPIAAPPAPATETSSSRYQYTLRQGNSFMSHTSDKAVADAQQALAKAQTADCLVVDRDGRRYLVTDPDVLRRIRENYAPLDAIGKQMEAKGKAMESAGEPMEALGKLMDAQGKQMEAIGLRMDEQGKLLEAAVAEGKSEAERQAIHAQMQELQKQMLAPQQEIRALSQKMREHSANIRPLGVQMREYGRQMRVASKTAEEGMTRILDGVFQNNQAVEQKVS